MNDERAYWLAFSRVSGIGVQRANDLRRHFGSLASAWHAAEKDLHAVHLPRFVIESLIATRRTLDVPQEMEKVAALGASLITLADAEYPYLLRKIANPPMVLYVRGELTPRDQRAIAVVGTRTATRTGKQASRQFSADLAAQGLTIISGLAQGIDAEAHSGALDVGGRTLAVLGSGIDIIYPRQHARLAQAIIDSGAVISEFPPGTPPEARNFPRRNRIISGLAQGVLVVEAPLKSGALITATAASEQGRDVFAIPASLANSAGHGCNRLIQDGAKLVMSIRDILEEVRPMEDRQQTREIVEQISADSPLEATVLEYLHGEPVHVDHIARSSGLPIADVLGVLTLLELKGLAQSVAPMQYCGTI